MEQKKNESEDPFRELTSWKEIAHYLGVHVRTAQKWERERGLPVVRVPGARSRVASDTLVLNAWKKKLAVTGGKQTDICMIWPLGNDVIVEIRFLGQQVTPAQIDLLLRYLGLYKSTLI